MAEGQVILHGVTDPSTAIALQLTTQGLVAVDLVVHDEQLDGVLVDRQDAMTFLERSLALLRGADG